MFIKDLTRSSSGAHKMALGYQSTYLLRAFSRIQLAIFLDDRTLKSRFKKYFLYRGSITSSQNHLTMAKHNRLRGSVEERGPGKIRAAKK